MSARTLTADLPTAHPGVRVKTREFQNYVMDSTRWDDLGFRENDIVIGTWAKSGTTWMQQIVGQLIFNGADDVPLHEISPWVDMRMIPHALVMARLEAQTHRRFMKTHLPADALSLSPHAKYIYVGRDARDVVWSTHAHLSTFTQADRDQMNNLPGRVGPPTEGPNPDVRGFYHEWLERDGHPAWPFWSHIQSWWDVRMLPNVLLVHFDDLKANLAGEIQRVARFLDIPIAASALPTIVEHCGFMYMKRKAEGVPGADVIIHKGTNGRWRGVLTAAEIAKCDEVASAHLTPDCADWLRSGKWPDRPAS